EGVELLFDAPAFRAVERHLPEIGRRLRAIFVDVDRDVVEDAHCARGDFIGPDPRGQTGSGLRKRFGSLELSFAQGDEGRLMVAARAYRVVAERFERLRRAVEPFVCRLETLLDSGSRGAGRHAFRA